MQTSTLIILIGVFIGVAGIVLLFASPLKEGSIYRRRTKKDTHKQPEKDWRAFSQRLEKRIGVFKRELTKSHYQQQKMLRESALEKVKTIKIQEKLSQEKQCIKHEAGILEKKVKEARQLQQNLAKAQQEREREYSLRIKIERELSTTQKDLEEFKKEKNELTVKLINKSSEAESSLQELSELKRISADLQKKNDEVNWVSKAEFERLEKLVQAKDKEIERILRNQS